MSASANADRSRPFEKPALRLMALSLTSATAVTPSETNDSTNPSMVRPSYPAETTPCDIFGSFCLVTGALRARISTNETRSSRLVA